MRPGGEDIPVRGHSMQEKIVAYLIGGLEIHEVEEVETALASDPTAADLLERLRRRILLLQLDKEERIEVPSGLAHRTCRQLRFMMQG